MKSDDNTIRQIFYRARRNVEAGLFLSLSILFSFIKILQLPTGGTVSIAAMPILIFSLRYGTLSGIGLGILAGFTNFLQTPVLVNVSSFTLVTAQVFLDYLAPALLLAFVGIFGKKSIIQIISGLFFVYCLKFVSHVSSGYLFFAHYAPEGWNPLSYSIIYNSSYLVPEFFLLAVLFFFIKKDYAFILNRDSVYFSD
ncbi:energy-coupled thiamine transporter ThiT [Candidatus Riflebacteria bacterium]